MFTKSEKKVLALIEKNKRNLMNEENKPSSASFANLTFTLSMGELSHEFKGEIFVKMSKKCATLLRQGITKSVIRRQIDPETFNAFVLACQLQPFKVTPKNAYPLLNLAQEWGIPSLEKFASDYIQSKNISPPEPIDCIQILASKIPSNSYTMDDINNVAADINEVLADERFLHFPPEVIFQTLLASDSHDIDPDLLLNLTMKLFDSKPSSAAPVTLLTNFEKYTPEQRRKILTSEKMVDLNFNYNVAWALSHAKNSSADGTKELLVRQHIKIAELAIQVDRARKVTKETYSNLHKQDIEDLKKQIEDQDAELNELYEILRNQSDAFEDAEAQRQEEFGPLHEGVDEVKKIGEESMLLEKSANEQTQMLIEENINQLRDDLVVKIEEIPVIHNIECDKIQEATDQLLQDPTLAIDEIVAKFDDYKEKVQKMSEIVASNRTTLTAKIVRDKLRCDEFIRDNDNRFEIFAESSHKWDVTVDQLKEAEEMIEDFERGLNTLCPIRGNAQYSPPQSPKASPKPSPKKNLDSEQSQTDRFQLEEEDEEEEEEEAYSCLNSVSSGHK